jgi:hypothetical protein
MLPEMLIASEGAGEASVVLGTTRHCGSASAPRPGLAKSSAIEGTAVMRRRGLMPHPSGSGSDTGPLRTKGQDLPRRLSNGLTMDTVRTSPQNPGGALRHG